MTAGFASDVGGSVTLVKGGWLVAPLKHTDNISRETEKLMAPSSAMTWALLSELIDRLVRLYRYRCIIGIGTDITNIGYRLLDNNLAHVSAHMRRSSQLISKLARYCCHAVPRNGSSLSKSHMGIFHRV